jgi:hypothetical protein
MDRVCQIVTSPEADSRQIALWRGNCRLVCVGVYQRHGRSRRAGNGRAHHLLLKRHDVLRGDQPDGAGTGFGHSASAAAMIAATSSSLGAGETVMCAAERAAASSVINYTLRLGVRCGFVVDRPRRSLWAGDHGAGNIVVERATLRVSESHEEANEKDHRDGLANHETHAGVTCGNEASVSGINDLGGHGSVSNGLTAGTHGAGVHHRCCGESGDCDKEADDDQSDRTGGHQDDTRNHPEQQDQGIDDEAGESGPVRSEYGSELEATVRLNCFVFARRPRGFGRLGQRSADTDIITWRLYVDLGVQPVEQVGEFIVLTR